MRYSYLALLFWVFAVHLAGIYLFTGGFLLTRLSLSDLSFRSEHLYGDIKPTHRRGILLIIDSLRFDFVSPDPPSPPSPFHHGILTLPRELTKTRPNHSFLFNSYADPPTATLQRIKGITTGSLPTFVDIGNNFGGSSITEDSIVTQFRLQGRSKLAFMGDDTWMSIFPDGFSPNMTHPYDSFNVEDLHTVDEGVIRHLFPLLEDQSKPFDFLVGHFLGVDHVGHRVGPDHPSMKAKLEQMNDVLTRVVEEMDDDTLLVVLGDHGMDRSGDHGGDGVLETSAATWIYSKTIPLTDTSKRLPGGLLQYRTFPDAPKAHRAIQQIDILPTMALLLGLPIPYNNLGTVIPELFWRESQLGKALEANAAQIMSYLETYRASPSGHEMDDAWPELQSTYANLLSKGTDEAKWVALINFNRVALAACRAMWAQFNPLLMALGLSLLGMGLCATWAVYSGLSSQKQDREGWVWGRLKAAGVGGVVGSVSGVIGHIGFASLMAGVRMSESTLFGAALASSIGLIISSQPIISFEDLKSTPLILILHAVAFFSNSFTFWEDRIVPYLLFSSILSYVRVGFSAPTPRLRYRIFGFSFLFAVCVRLMSISTICREEQQPYCHVTFFASSSLPSPPELVLYLAVPVAALLPFVVKRFLKITRSELGIAKTYLPTVLTPALIAGAGYWVMEWADSASVLGDEMSTTLRAGRTLIARFAFGWTVFVGVGFWWLVPLCLDIQVTVVDQKKQVKVLGFANAFGAPYLIFWTLFFALVYISTQLTGQLVLALAAVALIAFLEVLDSTRDVQGIEAALNASGPSAMLDPNSAVTLSPQMRFADVIPIALLGLHAFFGTGHQSTISSIQWKSAFLLTPTVSYPFSVITVVLNSIGPVFLCGLAVPLAGLWNRAPLPTVTNTQPSESPQDDTTNGFTPTAKTESTPDAQIASESTVAALGVMIYYSTLLLGTSVSAAILRRHLMVWKVFAPRFMTAVLELLAVDVGVLVGMGIGVHRIAGKMREIFRGPRTATL
ncbi:unnamed protein product [Cyclocybe aegerita]|uniref:GPI ethanolamine phosphate transferase 2 C-terminal domain-containing protein n=1 Tax=Cyclocybe aegerita TaxID=1973307 RepID=A0A8S0W1R6_CYCAE|nr:unnamed protein product [Cyclocybe aegerita]